MFVGPCSIKLIAGSGHPGLVQGISDVLQIPISQVTGGKLPNGETFVSVGECLRDQDVFICQTGHGSINDMLMEMLLMISGCKSASARRITAVIPCYPYARQDKKTKARCPITAKLVANLIRQAGADHVITMELHATQIKGFFKDIPVDNLLAEPLILQYIRETFKPGFVIVSPDAGGVKRAASISDASNADIAIIHKERAVANQVSKMVLVGTVQDRTCIIVDDMADTCGTLCLAAETLLSHGASAVHAIVVHPILSGRAIERIEGSPLTSLVVFNTTPLSPAAQECKKIQSINVASVFAEAIKRCHMGQSMSFLFKHATI